MPNKQIEHLMDERHAELACEWWGKRFNDPLRTDQAAAVLSGFVEATVNTFLFHRRRKMQIRI